MSGEVTQSPTDLSLRPNDLQPYGTTISEGGKVEGAQSEQPPQSGSGKDPSQESPTIENTGDGSASLSAEDRTLNEDITEDAGISAEAGSLPAEPESGKIRLTPETYRLLSDKEKFEYELAEAKILVADEKNNGTITSAEEGQISEAVAGIGDNPDSDQLKVLLKALSTIAELDSGNKFLAQEAYSRISEDITVNFEGITWTLGKLDEIYATADEARRKEIDRIKTEGNWGHKYPGKPESDTRTDGQIIDEEVGTQIKKLEDRLKGLDKDDPKRKQIEAQLDGLRLAEPAKGDLRGLVQISALRAVNDALVLEYGIGLNDRVLGSMDSQENIVVTKLAAQINLKGLNAIQQGQLVEFLKEGKVREFLSQKGLVDLKLINEIYGKKFKSESEANEYLGSLLSPAHLAENMKKYGKQVGLAALILLISGKVIADVGNEFTFDNQR